MNIWLLTTEYPPFYGGGIGTYAQAVAEMYAQKGHKVSVFVVDECAEEIMFNDNLRVIRFCSDSKDYSVYAKYYTQEILTRLRIELTKPDIIEAQDFMALGYDLLKTKLEKNNILKDIPIVIHLHTPFFECNRINQTVDYKKLEFSMSYKEKFAICAANGLIAPSVFMKEQINNLYPDLNIKVIPLPLPVEQQNKTVIQKTGTDLLYIGRLEERKGIYQFIKELVKLWEEGSKVTLTVVGEDTPYTPGSYLLGEKIKQDFKKYLNDGRLILINKLLPAELCSLHECAKIVVVPSLYENFPYVCIEAMQAGKPVLASVSGGQAELVGAEEKCGWLFDWQKDDDLLNKLKKAISLNKEDLNKIGNNARKRVTEICNWTDNLKDRLAYFNDVISSKIQRQEYPLVNTKAVSPKNSPSKDSNSLAIIITVNNYQSADILPTLRSCLLAGYTEKEILLVNNGVTDNKTLEVLSEIGQAAFPGVIMSGFPEKKSATFIRNYYAEKLNSKYICFLEAGELASENYFNKAIDMLKNYDNLFFVCGNFSDSNQQANLFSGLNSELPWLFFTNTVSPGVVYNRATLSEYGVNNEGLTLGYEEYESVLPLVLTGHHGVTLTEEYIWTKNNKNFSLFNKDIDPAVSVLFQSLLNKIPATTIKKYAVELLKIFNMVKYFRGKNLS